MLKTEQILLYLNNDTWFKPSNSMDKVSIKDNSGKTIIVSKSYYHKFNNSLGKIIIRVSEHGTYLNTWIDANKYPSETLQNVSIVFSNGPVNYKRMTKPKVIYDKDGNEKEVYQYFVVEQYVYRLDNLEIKDFNRIINTLKARCL